jgi:16S rRNA (adenine1518-N6/adenine1519-N6)-dimethyltransferase
VTTPTAAELLRRHGLTPRRSWGQNFLQAPEILDRIVAAATEAKPPRLVEIGAGLGALTGRLLETGSEVWAIERDRDLCRVLRDEFQGESRFVLHEADAVTFDYSSAATGMDAPVPVIGNLPYHLTGPLLFALLNHHSRTGAWIVMVQWEVAQRLLASPGGRIYGGVTAALSRVRALSLVTKASRGAFLPAPRVDSAVVKLEPLAVPRGPAVDPQAYLALVRAAFQKRRKTIANALSSLGERGRVLAWCDAAGVDPRLRPEQLGPETFAALQRAREDDHHA